MAAILRTLKLQTPSGICDIPIKMSHPAPSPSGGWFCNYSIAWPDGVRRSKGCGLDGIQAIELTLQKIGADLYLSPYHDTGQLSLEKVGDGYGFPVPRTIRDLLVGSDKAEYGGS